MPARPQTDRSPLRWIRTLLAAVTVLVAVLLINAPPSRAGDPTSSPVEAARRPMVVAYYYIWFNPTSWSRAKIDYPLVGRYSSDETRVMRQHVQWAREAGIEGFLVSWKSTEDLDDRLAKLAAVSREQGFKLGIVYQGLDFNRDPLPAARVASDLVQFAERYADDPVFQLKEKPVVALAGSWRFTVEELQSIAAPVQDELLVLGTEKDVDGVERIAGVLDGDAYYWSSMDATSPTTAGKLSDMASAVHGSGGVWIAPVSPGYDARLLGGARVVDRDDGRALRSSWSAAIGSDPDLLGVISWNEFSENTHIEPSRRHGYTSLEVLADAQGAPPPTSRDFDSSEPGGRTGPWRSLATFGVLGGMIAGCVFVVRLRNRRDAQWLGPVGRAGPGL